MRMVEPGGIKAVHEEQRDRDVPFVDRYMQGGVCVSVDASKIHSMMNCPADKAQASGFDDKMHETNKILRYVSFEIRNNA
mmetsp:Transcript_20289/g.34907  ORF Transcript_20289/g.34907 Transcript_20289/m.34907 type:complete len:80 (+) Transcript_20289:2395-2634(+)